MSRYQTAVYPFSQGLLPYFQPWTAGLIKKTPFDIAGLVAPNQFEQPRDIALIDNRPETGIALEPDLQKCLDRSDALLVPAANYPEESRGYLLKHMLQNIAGGKSIYCGYRLFPEEETALRVACERQNVNFVSAHALALQNGKRMIETGREKNTGSYSKLTPPFSSLPTRPPPPTRWMSRSG